MEMDDELKKHQEEWVQYSYFLPHLGDQLATLRVAALDPKPPPDAKGWRRADGWKLIWEGEVLKEWGNWGPTMHGGIAAWLIDNCSSAALVALRTPTFWGPPMTGGVSLSLDTTFLHPAPIGAKIRITAEILRMSETLANVKCEIANAETGKVFVFGNHVKAWKPPRPKAKL